MLELFWNIQTKTLVRGLTAPTEYPLPAWFAGETRTIRNHFLQPSGNPAAPFSEVAASAMVLALQRTDIPESESLSTWTVTGNYLDGTFIIPPDTGLLDSGAIYNEIVLNAQITISAELVRFEKPCVIKNPAFNFSTIPGIYQRFVMSLDAYVGLDSFPATAPLQFTNTIVSARAQIQKPLSASDNIFATPQISSFATTGCTFHLSAPIPATGYSAFVEMFTA